MIYQHLYGIHLYYVDVFRIIMDTLIRYIPVCPNLFIPSPLQIFFSKLKKYSRSKFRFQVHNILQAQLLSRAERWPYCKDLLTFFSRCLRNKNKNKYQYWKVHSYLIQIVVSQQCRSLSFYFLIQVSAWMLEFCVRSFRV